MSDYPTARSGSAAAPNLLRCDALVSTLAVPSWRGHFPTPVKVPHAPEGGDLRARGDLFESVGNSSPCQHRAARARPATAPSTHPTETAAPHPRRRPDTGRIFLDRVPGQGSPEATGEAGGRSPSLTRCAIEKQSNQGSAANPETKPRPLPRGGPGPNQDSAKPAHRPQQQAVSSKHDRVARVDAPSP